MRVQYQDIGFRAWPQADSQQGLGLGIRVPSNHYGPSSPRKVGVKVLQLCLKPSATGYVAQTPLGPSKVVQAEAGLDTADPAPGAPESGGLVPHVLQSLLHRSQPRHACGSALWP